MRYPVVPVKLPTDLARLTNGKLPARLLAPAAGGGQLHHAAARAWQRLVEAAAAAGIELDNVGAYRSYEQQVAMFKDRYQTTPNGSRVTRRWNGITYYLKPGKAPSATPGTSNHGWGLAIDVANIGSDNRLPWLRDNAGRYGFTWEVADSTNPNFEPWHIRYVLGDDGTPAAGTTAPTATTLRLGDNGPAVVKLQWALTDAGYLCKADGEFGPVTRSIVEAFQRDHGLTVDGLVGPKTRAALGL